MYLEILIHIDYQNVWKFKKQKIFCRFWSIILLILRKSMLMITSDIQILAGRFENEFNLGTALIKTSLTAHLGRNKKAAN